MEELTVEEKSAGTISGMAGDQQAALFGQACFRKKAQQKYIWYRMLLLMNTGDEIIQSKMDL